MLGSEPSGVLVALREAAHADAAFDQLLPADARLVSRRFWTPATVAQAVAVLFRQFGARRVLDVGAGAGKFCLIAAKAATDLQFVGVEQRACLVRTARDIQSRLGIENTQFILGDATRVDWTNFDGFYFYNPFMENIFDASDHFDESVELSSARFVADVTRAEAALDEAPIGTCVITYYRFGGRLPASYELAHAEPAFAMSWIRVWVKSRERATGYYLETDNGAYITCTGPRPKDPRRDVVRMLSRWR